MKLVWEIILSIIILAVGLLLTIKPEKAMWGDNVTKGRILVMRIVGIVLLLLMAAAGFALFMGVREGQIVF